MSGKEKTTWAGIIASMAIASTGVVVSATGDTHKHIFTALTIVLLIGIVALIFGGFPCKERLHKTLLLCWRCSGFASGILIATILFVSFHKQVVERASSGFAGVAFLAVGCIFSIPTVWHGTIRRRGLKDPLPTATSLFFIGLLTGVGVLFCAIGFEILLSDTAR